MTPFSLVTSRFVNPAAPCASQVVMTTRRWLPRTPLATPENVAETSAAPSVVERTSDMS